MYQVCVKDFALSKYEVTVREFRAFVAATGYRTDAERSTMCTALDRHDEKNLVAPREWATWRTPTNHEKARDDDPVRCVTWNDAQAYVQWLNSVSGGGYRLPSEAEWEYAARAGTRTAYFWGDSDAAACLYANVFGTFKYQRKGEWHTKAGKYPCSDGHMSAAPVGSYRPNQWGLYDTIGNVAEWVEDCWHNSYRGTPPSDGSAWRSGECSTRIARGGFYLGGRSLNRSAARFAPKVDSIEVIGFRVARDVGE